MTDYKAVLIRLNQNLHILQEREAKYGGNTPIELINQINDYKEAIDLTQQTINEELSEADWQQSLKSLVIDVNLISIISSQHLLKDFQKEQQWILVAGLGQVNLWPEFKEVYYSALAIGRTLAIEGFGLLVGGWSGVDYIVADEFHKELRKLGKPLSAHLLQVIPEGHLPQFHGGKVVHTKSGWLEWQDIVQKSDAIVLIGGEGGTYQTYQFALQEQVPIFPLAGTKGDAQQVFNEMLANWDSQLMGNVSLEMFIRTLSRNLDTEEDAQQIGRDVIELIRHRLR